MGRTRRVFSAFALSALLAAAALPSGASAQILINEILPNPSGDDVGTERVEIYNAGPNPVDLTGWAIDDAATIDEVAVRCRIPEDFDATCSTNPIIGPGEFRVVKGTSTAAWLNNGGDDVYLISDRTLNPNVVHQVTYGSASLQVDMVWAALPNGTANFDWRAPTLCASNGATGDVTPPGDIVDLAAAAGAFPGEVRLTWTAAGDDGFTGQASDYLIKVSNVPIHAGNFDASADLERWISAPLPLAGGEAETLYVFGMDPDSTYFFAVKTQDEVPNTSGVSNSPSATPAQGALMSADVGLPVWFGNLHSHTSYSDGMLTPADAYAYARNTAQTPLDFLAVTEHNHSSAGMALPSYGLLQAQAAAANEDGQFVAIFGQEWGFAANGHVNVYESPVLFGWEPGNYDVFVAEGDYAGLYTAAVANPPASSPVLLSWAHPGASDFDNYQVTANGLAAVHLMALVNGPANSTSTTESDIGNTGYDDELQNALFLGYRVSPVGDQDNHNANWGAATESRTGVLAPSLTKAGILGALAARRCYATQDHNVIVHFSADGHAMGEAFEADSGVRIAVEVMDPDVGDEVVGIDLYRGVTGSASATRVAFNAGSPRLHWRELEPFAPGTEAHYYVRVRTADNATIWTGPVYVTYEEPVPVAVDPGTRGGGTLSLAAGPNPSGGPVAVRFTLPEASAGVSLAVYDVGGRRVRTLARGALGAGAHRVEWDGRDDGGARVGAGLFFLRLEADAQSASAKVMMLK